MSVIILGAGAAGLFCAREAARRGISVTVVDRSEEPGRKLLLSGGGRCNFTNLRATAEHYLSANPSFPISALKRFSPMDFIRLLDEHGVPYREEKNGQMFCAKGAASVRDMLVEDCRAAGLSFLLGNAVEAVVLRDGAFEVRGTKETLSAPRLIVACGGLAAPGAGASGFGLELARQFGLATIEPAPALVGLRLKQPDQAAWGPLSGISLPDVQVSAGGRDTRGSLLFTHTGLSGPAILDASLYWRPGQTLTIDLFPGVDPAPRLKNLRRNRGTAQAWEIMRRHFPRRFTEVFAAAYLPADPVARLSNAGIAGIAEKLKSWPLQPADTEGYERAEVMRGGVDTRELSSQTMESRKVPGLFFIGEVVDVTGRLGGFNLQWAWSSAFASAHSL